MYLAVVGVHWFCKIRTRACPAAPRLPSLRDGGKQPRFRTASFRHGRTECSVVFTWLAGYYTMILRRQLWPPLLAATVAAPTMTWHRRGDGGSAGAPHDSGAAQWPSASGKLRSVCTHVGGSCLFGCKRVSVAFFGTLPGAVVFQKGSPPAPFGASHTIKNQRTPTQLAPPAGNDSLKLVREKKNGGKCSKGCVLGA